MYHHEVDEKRGEEKPGADESDQEDQIVEFVPLVSPLDTNFPQEPSHVVHRISDFCQEYDTAHLSARATVWQGGYQAEHSNNMVDGDDACFLAVHIETPYAPYRIEDEVTKAQNCSENLIDIWLPTLEETQSDTSL